MIDLHCPYCHHRQQFFDGGFVAACAACGQPFTVPFISPPTPRRRHRRERDYDGPVSTTSGLGELISIMSALAAGGVAFIALVIPAFIAIFFGVLGCLLAVVALVSAGCAKSTSGGAVGVVFALLAGGFSFVVTILVISQLSSATRHF